MTYEQVRPAITGHGALSVAEFDEFLELFDDRTFSWHTPVVTSIAGQRPGLVRDARAIR